MKKIFLCLIIVSVILQADFSRSASGVVTDDATGLQWQDNANSTTMTWQAGIDYCEALSLDGGGWRLPNLNELTSIVDDTRSNPAIDSTFKNTISDFYWSSTTMVNSTSYVWVVYFGVGGQFGDYKTDNDYVRCVRSGQ